MTPVVVFGDGGGMFVALVLPVGLSGIKCTDGLADSVRHNFVDNY